MSLGVSSSAHSTCNHSMCGECMGTSSYVQLQNENSSLMTNSRSYYVVSWVPRALPEVLQLIKEIPNSNEQRLITKHFELGMLVMRRCGNQNPEEIKCLLDGFREGTTRLSMRDAKNPGVKTSYPDKSDSEKFSNYSTPGSYEKKKLLVFYNDHRASRPWVLCPAKHCIQSARTTGKVKGRVKIFQFDAQTSTVSVPKLFTNCLANYLTTDKYVFATFCPQQKYTDHELQWFEFGSRKPSFQINQHQQLSGGDQIFRELLEERDVKGSKAWPFDDYIIFANSEARIVAVFKKKQPLLTLYRHNWKNVLAEYGQVMPGIPPVNQPSSVRNITTSSTRASSQNTPGLCSLTSSDTLHSSDASSCEALLNGVISTTLKRSKMYLNSTESTTSTEDEEDSNNMAQNRLKIISQAFGKELDNVKVSLPRSEETSDVAQCESKNFNVEDIWKAGNKSPQVFERSASSDKESEDVSKYTSLTSFQVASNEEPAPGKLQKNSLSTSQAFPYIPDISSAVAMGILPSPELISQAEEAENVLVKIMTEALAQLDPFNDTVQPGNPGEYVSSHVTSDTVLAKNSVVENKCISENISNNQHSKSSVETHYEELINQCFSKNVCNPTDDSLSNGKPSNLEENQLNGFLNFMYDTMANVKNESLLEISNPEIHKNRRNETCSALALDVKGKRRKTASSESPPTTAVLYHDLVRQFFSTLAFRLDHPPLPQKRIPDTVKRAVTRIVSDSIKEINLALLTSSIRLESQNPSSEIVYGSMFHEQNVGMNLSVSGPGDSWANSSSDDCFMDNNSSTVYGFGNSAVTGKSMNPIYQNSQDLSGYMSSYARSPADSSRGSLETSRHYNYAFEYSNHITPNSQRVINSFQMTQPPGKLSDTQIFQTQEPSAIKNQNNFLASQGFCSSLFLKHSGDKNGRVGLPTATFSTSINKISEI